MANIDYLSCQRATNTYIYLPTSAYAVVDVCVFKCMRVLLLRLYRSRALACRAGGNVCATGMQARVGGYNLVELHLPAVVVAVVLRSLSLQFEVAYARVKILTDQILI